jgi:hypothetical protein
MKIAVFWVVAPGGLAMIIALMMEAARTSETLVNFYQTTRCYNPEDSNLQKQSCLFRRGDYRNKRHNTENCPGLES